MNIRDKIHPSKQPVGATHYNEDWRCSETEGIQYFKVGVGEYHFWSGGRWVIGNTRMPSSTITPLPNLQIETYATAPHVNCNFASLTEDLKPTDPADELGKVWDVLHAAGINSGGELSASEGVKLLAGRFTGELMDAYQALQEDFAKLKAREDAARTLLHDASVSLYAKGMSQYEQPRVAMIAWLEE